MAVGEIQARVLIVDDDLELGAMLQEYLRAEGFPVTLSGTGEHGLDEALSGRHDIMILDVMLPLMSGIDVLRKLRQSSQLPVLMLTAKGDGIDRVVGLELGADDYVPKPPFPRELVARLRAILRRQRETAEANGVQPHCKALQIDVRARRVSVSGVPLTLTASEFDLLALLMKSGDAIATKEELSLKVLGRVRQPYDRSVDVHVSNLRQKMHALPGAPEIETIRGVGYRLMEPR